MSDNLETQRITLDKADRTRGERFFIASEGGVLIDFAPAGMEMAFDDDPRRVPLSTGRKYVKAFRTITIYHAAGLSGQLVLILFSGCAEVFSEAAPATAKAAPLLDLLQDPAGYAWGSVNASIVSAGGAPGAAGRTFTAGYSGAPSCVNVFGKLWNQLQKTCQAFSAPLSVPLLAGAWPRAIVYEVRCRIGAIAPTVAFPFRPTFSDLGFGILQGTNAGQQFGPQQAADTPGVSVGVADASGGLALFRREAAAPYGNGTLTRTPLAVTSNVFVAPVDVLWRVRSATATADAVAELEIDGAPVAAVPLPPLYGVVRQYYPALVASTDQDGCLLYRDFRYRVVEA